MNRWIQVAEIALAGALAGFLIGPDSLEQFIGSSFNNSLAFNVITGAAVGTVLGFLATMMSTQAE